MGQIGLFDHENRLAELSEMGDPLEIINRVIRWKSFRPIIDKVFHKERKSNAGRPPYDYVLMFKILVLQTMYGLSDAQTRFQILDRMTFKRFLGLAPEAAIPDEKTVWLFRETPAQAGVIKKLFDLFGRQLAEVHDSNVLEPLLNPDNTNADVFADSAYHSAKAEERLEYLWYRSRVCVKGTRGAPLTEARLAQNRRKSKVRSRIEHVFAQIELMSRQAQVYRAAEGCGEDRTPEPGVQHETLCVSRRPCVKSGEPRDRLRKGAKRECLQA
jgi:IS5 family transposase